MSDLRERVLAVLRERLEKCALPPGSAWEKDHAGELRALIAAVLALGGCDCRGGYGVATPPHLQECPVSRVRAIARNLGIEEESNG